jgi:hypothetical protein
VSHGSHCIRPTIIECVRNIARAHVQETMVTEDFSVTYEPQYGTRHIGRVRAVALILWACVMTTAAHGSLLISKEGLPPGRLTPGSRGI